MDTPKQDVPVVKEAAKKPVEAPKPESKVETKLDQTTGKGKDFQPGIPVEKFSYSKK